jgi:hypothetical protein
LADGFAAFLIPRAVRVRGAGRSVENQRAGKHARWNSRACAALVLVEAAGSPAVVAAARRSGLATGGALFSTLRGSAVDALLDLRTNTILGQAASPATAYRAAQFAVVARRRVALRLSHMATSLGAIPVRALQRYEPQECVASVHSDDDQERCHKEERQGNIRHSRQTYTDAKRCN